MEFAYAMSALAAGISVISSGIVGLGQGIATGKAAEAIARQPEAKGSIMSTLVIGIAVAETTAIYGFVIGILLLFANPLLK